MTICMGKPAKNINTWKLANMLLSSQWSQKKKKKNQRRNFCLIPGDAKNKDTMIQNLWDITKHFCKGSLNQYKPKSYINNLSSHLNELEKEQTNARFNRKK